MFETMHGSPSPEEVAADLARAALIGQQNDRFRTTWGADFTIPGRIVMTRGVADLGFTAHVAIMAAVQRFASFTEDNDPYGTRDFGIFSVMVEGREVRLYWKIDLYDAAYQFGSDDAADPRKTRRLLTLLLPEEY
ncbi:DUF3768 domain-containing protein [Cereibacter sphaeroides]|uniref:DUF3768 domain-containing protein n=1 Tax=Cereibacter sphaeroides TaxID=1063 RepID=UPI001F2F17CD|nr:DUF3768 domain-containing protein [Cereibacter sphaeroides]MCE6967506.1 DUF3768 domain-containing protein [Cereibacter sphaeroides]